MSFESFDTRIIPCRSAEDILEYIEFGSSILTGASYGDIGFRGQADATWPLNPAAFRSKSTLGHVGAPVPGRQLNIGLQVRAEILSVRQFAERADRIGLHVPGPFHEFRSATRWDEPDRLTIKDWPKTEYHEIVAMGQHHGVPTRLLDFSYNPLTAGVFAALESYICHRGGKRGLENPNRESDKYFAIWVIDLRMIRRAWNERMGRYRRRFLPRVREVRVPRASNEFLHAQDGFFLLDVGANHELAHGRYENMDLVINRFSANWIHRNDKKRRSKKRVRRRMNVLSNPIIKLVANWAIAGDLLRIMYRKGISLPLLKPDYDHVVSGIELERELT